MNDQSEATGMQWFGLDRLRLADGDQAVDVTIGAEGQWDRSHLRRLRQSGDLPGMVPVIDSDFAPNGLPFAVTPVVDEPTLESLIDQGDLDWTSGAGITEAVARAAHEAHLRGLFHGALSPEDIHLVGDDVAISGIGLGLGGTPPPERSEWVAPEVRDGHDPTERSDVYSLGRILERSLGEAVNTAPRSIRRLIMWSSSDTPEARPPSALEFASILAEGLGEDRQTYGPAFVPTGNTTGLAAQAATAVTDHAPASTDPVDLADGGGIGIATAVGAASLTDDDSAAPSETPDAGFAISDTTKPDAEATEVEAESPADADTEEVVDEVAATADLDPADIDADSEVASDSDDDEQGDATPEVIESPPEAQTIDLDETLVPPKRRNLAGLAIGAILFLGLAGIIWGIMATAETNDEAIVDGTAAGDETSTDEPESSATSETTADDTSDTAPSTSADQVANAGSAPSTSESPATTEASTTSEAPATTEASTTAAPSTTPAPPTTAATTSVAPPTTAASTTTEAPSTTAAPVEADSDSLAPAAVGAVAAGEAKIQLLHGVPGVDADVYIDGEAIAAGFGSGSVAGPIELDAGTHEIEMFAADSPVAASSEDRTDEPVATSSIQVGAEPASLIAHLDEDGEIALSTFDEDLQPLDPGKSRVTVRNLMAAGSVDASIDGEAIGSLEPGEETAAEVDAGSILVEFEGDDGKIIASDTLAVADGELASLSAIGSPADGTAEIVIQRYSGLSTAPSGVPTGDSGLLGSDGSSDLRLVYGLIVVMVAGGAVLALLRRRALP